jgi:hypothetical protein
MVKKLEKNLSELENNNKESIKEELSEIENIEDKNIKIKGKRGRKPKNYNKENDIENNKSNVLTIKNSKIKSNESEENEDVIVGIPKKRGRKPKDNKIKNLKVFDINQHLMEEQVSILHLPINNNDLNSLDKSLLGNDILKYNPEIPNEPIPFDPRSNDKYSSLNMGIMDINEISYNENEINEEINHQNINNNIKKFTQENSIIMIDTLITNNNIHKDNKEINKKEEDIDNNYIKKNLKNIQYEFIESNMRNSWPMRVNIACLWDCHTFDTVPIAIPKKYVNGIFYLYGIFCDFPCAAKYLFNSNKSIAEKQEEFALLNLLKTKLTGNNKKIEMAGPRETLTLFGGYKDIVKFRSVDSIENKTYNLIEYPLISLVPTVEENTINYSIKEDECYIPINKSMMKRANDSLKLVTNKGNKNKTLIQYMKLE